MPPVESSIDDLYKGPLSEFVPARTRLAKTLTGPEAQRVKALKKPTLVPWTVNQVYWHARPVYDRLAKSGAALRSAQVAALSGRPANVRGATESHRKAITEAVAEASRLAFRADAHPSAEELARMFEAISVTPELPDPPGRLVKTLAPPGFEALAGIAIKPAERERSAPPAASSAPPSTPFRPTLVTAAPADRVVEDNRRREREEAAAERRKRAAIQKAETAMRRATAAEARTRQAWERAQEERQNAASKLAALRAK
jgi:type IV secretory pathway VirB10-like protein